MLEIGASVGNNLRAISRIADVDLWGLEPNDKARERLIADKVVASDKALAGPGTELNLPDASIDLVFTSGVLIHIHPDDLLENCAQMHRVARRYIVCIEYFSDKLSG